MAVTRFAQDNAEIRTRFKELFEDVYPEIRVVWENEPSDKASPDGVPSFPKLDCEYVRVVIRNTNSKQISTGFPRAFRHYGIVAVFIQTRFGKGTGRSETIADLIGEVLGAVTVGGIVYRDPRHVQNGVADGQWYHSTFTVEYWSTFLES